MSSSHSPLDFLLHAGSLPLPVRVTDGSFGAIEGQEPGTEEGIQDFGETILDVSFPVFAKIDVNGPPIKRYEPPVPPASIKRL